MKYRIRYEKLRDVWVTGVKIGGAGTATLWLKWITNDFEIRKGLQIAELQFYPTPEAETFKRYETSLFNQYTDQIELSFKAPEEADYFKNKFATAATIYGFAWVQTPRPRVGIDPLFLVVKYDSPVTIAAGDSHGIAHTVSFGPQLVLPA
jgi:hypothetical protein